jgi:hypothetical protein
VETSTLTRIDVTRSLDGVPSCFTSSSHIIQYHKHSRIHASTHVREGISVVVYIYRSKPSNAPFPDAGAGAQYAQYATQSSGKPA